MTANIYRHAERRKGYNNFTIALNDRYMQLSTNYNQFAIVYYPMSSYIHRDTCVIGIIGYASDRAICYTHH